MELKLVCYKSMNPNSGLETLEIKLCIIIFKFKYLKYFNLYATFVYNVFILHL